MESIGALDGKVVLITGAAQGQGRAHSLRFAQEGADVIALDLCAQDPAVGYPTGTPAGLAETAALISDAGRRVVAKPADIRDRAGLAAVIDAAVAELGRLDVVVANAGICTSQPWEDVTEQVWDATLATNLTGTWNTCRASIPHLAATGGGSIVVISSAAGLGGPPFLLPYVVSKHGLVGLMRALANEVGPLGIRVNSVHPGGVETPMGDGTHEQMRPLLDARPEFAGMFGAALPYSRMTPEDITPTVLYLASDASRFVTGTTLAVDAGITNR